MKNLEQDISRFKIVGELESYGREPLPLTPITRNARRKLEQWGISSNLIEQIRSFTSGFRYEFCLEKTQRLTQSPVYITGSRKKEFAKVPYFFDTQGRMDGQCGDIGRMFTTLAELTGLIEELNTEPSGLHKNERIVSCFCSGTSSTHFCNEGNTHIWNGLALIKGKNKLIDSIIIDAAFQKIMTPEESGYQRRRLSADLIGIRDIEVHSKTQIGSVTIDEDNWNGDLPQSMVLGVSNDRNYAYSLSFARVNSPYSKKASNPSVVLSRTTEKGHRQYFMIHPGDGSLLRYDKRLLYVLLLPWEQEEIMGILNECAGFEFRQGSMHYPIRKNLRQKIIWKQ